MIRIRIAPLLLAGVLVGPAAAAQSGDGVLPRHVQLGASLDNVPDSLIRKGAPAGVLVLSTIPGTPATEAGIHGGDILVRIGRDTVRSVPEALSILRQFTGAARVAFTLVRDRGVVTLIVPLRERAKEASSDFSIEYGSVAARHGRHRIIVTRPSDTKAHPAVLLIGGIGCYSIDVPAGPSAYRDLAYHLTRRGYTTVRVEKLGVGDSEGGPCIETDLESEVDGYRQALIAMAKYASVDRSHIFVFGHSIGGIEGPLLAAESLPVPRIRGVAVLSTTGVSWYEYELANLRRQLELQNFAPDSIEVYMRRKVVCGFRFLMEKRSHDAIIASDSSCAPFVAYPASDAYMHAVADIPPATIWQRVSAVALVMYGSSDFVTSRSEHVQLTDYINAMHPGNARFAEISQLDHYLSQQASQYSSFVDPIPNLSRPYYGMTLEPVLDRWLDELSRSP